MKEHYMNLDKGNVQIFMSYVNLKYFLKEDNGVSLNILAQTLSLRLVLFPWIRTSLII